ncbi:kininogen-1 [Talpa occidentalis]|uniref:kininogen-1 n=1 Tax=Talpa occidentalis TaxID=50954 RepID=UPI00188E9687|nr:kininogen-1 [Talpa occidentalis]
MRLITILFLCSRLLSSLSQESFSQEIGCDDEDVFKAVDAALKKYNDGNKSGNQFVLYRISNVTLIDDLNQYYSFKYQVKEGDCPVQSGKSWQNCDYKQSADASTGECTVTVAKSRNNKFTIATQTCQITPGEGPMLMTRYNCLGCKYPVSAADSHVHHALNQIITHFNNHSSHSHLFALKEVKSAYKQVVAGWNFDISYSIMETNCSKADFPLLTPDCQILSDGDLAECTDKAFMDTSQRISSLTQNCEHFPGMRKLTLITPTKCADCPKEIPVDSPELKEVLNHSVKKLNAENNGTFYFKIDNVKKATVQVVDGKKYYIEFTARETTCSKESNIEFSISCETKEPGKALICNAWMNKIELTVNCKPKTMIMMRKRPPGFSPFRSAMMDGIEETTVSSPHTSMIPVQDEEQYSEKSQEHTHGHGRAHKKQIKHGLGHGHKHEHGQGHGHIRGHGFGVGHQRELDYDLESQRRHGFGHGHQRGHGHAHGHKHEHGHGHGKHKNKNKSNGKHKGRKTEHLAISSEDSTTPSTQTQTKTEGPTPTPSLAQPEVTVTFADFQDSDLFAAVMPNPSPAPTESDDDWIPNIQVEPDSFSFSLIPDFPETTSPKCPGRPWEPVNEMNPAVEMKEFHDFDLSDALYK